MKPRSFYKGYHLAAMTTEADDGRYRARVVIMALDGKRTRSQRFVDMGLFETRTLADDCAIESGKSWVDAQLRQEQLGVRTNFVRLD